MRAYVAGRILKGGNGGLEQATRHAVSDWTWWAMSPGPADSECGVVGALEVGAWVADDPRNCSRCTRAIERHALQQDVPRRADDLVPALS